MLPSSVVRTPDEQVADRALAMKMLVDQLPQVLVKVSFFILPIWVFLFGQGKGRDYASVHVLLYLLSDNIHFLTTRIIIIIIFFKNLFFALIDCGNGHMWG